MRNCRSNSLEDPLKRGQRQVESTKLLLGLSIDDAHFRNLLLETQVLSTKDHTKWNVEIMLELLEGPLLNPKRLDEAMRASKFMRRLCGFFHPFGYRYSEIRKSRVSVRTFALGRWGRKTKLTKLTRPAHGQVYSTGMYALDHAPGQPGRSALPRRRQATASNCRLSQSARSRELSTRLLAPITSG